MNPAVTHSLLALRAQVEAMAQQIDALVAQVSCEHPESERQYLSGFGEGPVRFFCKRCGCEVEEG